MVDVVLAQKPMEDNMTALRDEQYNYAEPLFGHWTPAAFKRDGGKFAEEKELFIVSVPMLNKYIEGLIYYSKQELLDELVSVFQDKLKQLESNLRGVKDGH